MIAPREICDVPSLLAAIAEGYHPEFVFFWRHRAPPDGAIGEPCLSQWWPATFEVEGVVYPTAEHYMMAEKARLFDDAETLQRILATKDPAKVKSRGRDVRGFDEERWCRHRFEIVVRGNVAKFGQHDDLRAYLLGTGDQVLVEASPRDRVWGIGLGAEDPAASDVRRWRGLNLLGFALMCARSALDGARQR
jgi:ribA/ribD-fused uncharacterized protein